MTNASVLVFGEDSAVVETVRDVIDLVPGCKCFAVSQIDEAVEFLADPAAALAIYHATPENSESLDWLLQEMAAKQQGAATLVICDDDRPEAQLKMLERGAADCLTRPLNLRRLSFLIDSLTLRGRYGSRGPAAIPEAAPPAAPHVDLQVGGSAAALDRPARGVDHFEELVRKVARQDATVLLTGETGTGKTHLARVIHSLSPRQHEPFLSVNCASLAESLLESELFGHSKGSFTGADVSRTGRFAAAGAGTLLLDEIDSLSLALQKKLLQAVDERVFEPVGSNRSQPLQARLLVATNRNLPDEIAAGRFRDDLYYRLNIIEIGLPPLRRRPNLIPTIAESYLRECAERNGQPVPRISDEAWDMLLEFHWPGNIRELRNAMARALALCDDGVIIPNDLPDAIREFTRRPISARPAVSGAARPRQLSLQPAATGGVESEAERPADFPSAPHLSALAQARAEGEIVRIKRALVQAGNNRTRASEELGISRVALYKKLRRFGLLDS